MAIIAGSTLGFTTDWNTSDQAFPWRSNTTILDEMTAAGVSWNYFNCNYNECPLSFFTQGPSWIPNEQDTTTLVSDIKTHTLPDVSFVMPDSDEVSDEPPGNLTLGQDWIHGVINDLNSSGYLKSTVVLLTWDDSGGWFDHVTPPGQYGYRVPMIMLAPYGPKGIINHDLASHYSIPTVIESVFGLPCMHEDCNAYNLLDALNPPTTSSAPAQTSLVASSGLILSSTSAQPSSSTGSITTTTTTTTVVPPVVTSTEAVTSTVMSTVTDLATVTQTVTSTAHSSTTLTYTKTVTGPTTTVTGPTTTRTSTQVVPLNVTENTSAVPAWVYATMALLLIIGLSVGYVVKRPPRS
jgi:phospholipase C